ncbi:hypothetical protein SODALDRAFT_359877 [Sodiomyces alkalinus F11]|uniref:Uncharacterized protein n=1 Tax=Sodiomyces alkalinus (strain CBS 110278 / VKM F-3762 / F11) TaxID=1314773 RepID=A0A3N2PW81_SODAK|nr:hypothetical protein SODALDRAFT_359877 [Sodiomyces alkalinus F11]ROT38769.1 hypothetical protein SODALDRAFT_359877 [Sodiomyces alkalinus F11]
MYTRDFQLPLPQLAAASRRPRRLRQSLLLDANRTWAFRISPSLLPWATFVMGAAFSPFVSRRNWPPCRFGGPSGSHPDDPFQGDSGKEKLRLVRYVGHFRSFEDKISRTPAGAEDDDIDRRRDGLRNFFGIEDDRKDRILIMIGVAAGPPLPLAETPTRGRSNTWSFSNCSGHPTHIANPLAGDENGLDAEADAASKLVDETMWPASDSNAIQGLQSTLVITSCEVPVDYYEMSFCQTSVEKPLSWGAHEGRITKLSHIGELSS